MDSVVIYTDGSSRGNPGPGGYGAVLRFWDASGKLHTRELSQGFVETTNNRMELMGVIAALKALKRPCKVDLYTDSQYVALAFTEHRLEKWIQKGWKLSSGASVKNVDLWLCLISAAEPHELTWHWTRGHAGDELNERCDELAREAADGKAGDLLKDVGYQEAAV